MLAILNSFKGPQLPHFSTIELVHRALSDKTYLSLGLLSPLTNLGRHAVFSKKHKLHTHSFGFNFLLAA